MATDFAVEINGARLQRDLQALAARLNNMTPVYSVIGEMIKASVVRNFEEGGRYSAPGDWRGGNTRWQPLSPVTLAKITRGRGGMGHRKILDDGEHLLHSISWQAANDGVRTGTNLVYAAIHNFGGKAGRSHKVTIPARPFLVIQDEDIEQMNTIMNHYLMGD